jgi:hypothetical protein
MKRDSIKLEKEERKWIVMEKVPEIKIKLTDVTERLDEGYLLLSELSASFKQRSDCDLWKRSG